MTSRLRHFFLLLLLLCAVRAEAVSFMPVEDIRPGMQGYGLSVFKGHEVERFDIETVDVVQHFVGPRSHGILVKISGGPDDILERAKVIAGMSGSPIFVYGDDGEEYLIGALAYGWGFQVDAIAGVTPIAEMLDVLALEPEKPTRRLASSGIFTPDDVKDVASFQAAILGGGSKEWRQQTPALAGLPRLKTPIAMTGLSGRSMELLRPFLNRFGMEPVAGGGAVGASKIASAPSGFENGGSIGAALFAGDASGIATGTVTYVDGDRLVAFGHPMFQLGPVNMPVGPAYVNTIISNQMSSFKLGSATKFTGSLDQDRLTAIACTIGDVPRMVPLTVTVDYEMPGTKYDEPFQFDIYPNQDFLSLFATFLLRDALVTGVADSQYLTLKARMRVEFADQPPLDVTRRYSGLSPTLAAVSITQPLAEVLINDFEAVNVKSIDVTFTPEEEQNGVSIEEMLILNGHVQPGDTLEVLLRLRNYRGEVFDQIRTLDLPRSMAPGSYKLVFYDESVYQKAEKKRAPIGHIPETLPDMIRRLNEETSVYQARLMILSGESGVVLEGQEHPSLPPTFRKKLTTNKAAGMVSRTQETVVVREIIDYPYPVTGSATLSVDVSE